MPREELEWEVTVHMLPLEGCRMLGPDDVVRGADLRCIGVRRDSDGLFHYRGRPVQLFSMHLIGERWGSWREETRYMVCRRIDDDDKEG